MSRVTEAGMDGGLEGDVQRTEQRAVGEREVRWSARRKEGVVMRLLRGESLDLLARESGQPALCSPECPVNPGPGTANSGERLPEKNPLWTTPWNAASPVGDEFTRQSVSLSRSNQM